MPTLSQLALNGCNTSMNKGKKKHFTESKLEIVVNDVEPRREILSGPLSAGINIKRKVMSGSVCVRQYMPWGPSSAHTHR